MDNQAKVFCLVAGLKELANRLDADYTKEGWESHGLSLLKEIKKLSDELIKINQ